MSKLPIVRRKAKPNPVAKAANIVKLGVHGLVVARHARRGVKTYKFTRRAVPLAGLAALGVIVARKLRGGGEAQAPSQPAAGTTAGTTAGAAATAATGTPPVTDTAPAPTAPSESPAAEPASGEDIPAALADAEVEGDGPDTPEQAAGKGRKA